MTAPSPRAAAELAKTLARLDGEIAALETRARGLRAARAKVARALSVLDGAGPPVAPTGAARQARYRERQRQQARAAPLAAE